ncbi:RNA polymerase sigma factor [Fluviicola sp.]|uniref:RNA polymerase sigma factor n=1 Tax=Fluviicola sp. TaxID=1917219 RepID=UPI0031DB8CD2
MLTKEIEEQFTKGNRKAFDAVYAAFSAAMFALCLRYTRCQDDAQDVLQEAFIKVYKSCGQYSTDKPLAAWIKTITINTALSYIKKNYRFELHEDDAFFDEQQEIQFDAEDQEHLKNKLLQILNELPDGYRTIFNLFVIENLTHKEIAEYLSISESTSKTQYFKAKKMIHSLLEAANQKA